MTASADDHFPKTMHDPVRGSDQFRLGEETERTGTVHPAFELAEVA